jgi:hypothetical protein
LLSAVDFAEVNTSFFPETIRLRASPQQNDAGGAGKEPLVLLASGWQACSSKRV